MKSTSSMGLGSLVSHALWILDEIEELRRSVFAGMPNRKDEHNEALDQKLKDRLDQLVNGLPKKRIRQLIRHYELTLTPFIGEWASYFLSYRNRFKDQAGKVTWKWIEGEIEAIVNSENEVRRNRDLNSRAVDDFLSRHSDSIDPCEVRESKRRIESAFAQNLAIGLCDREGLEFDVEIWNKLLEKSSGAIDDDFADLYMKELRARANHSGLSSRQSIEPTDDLSHQQAGPEGQVVNGTEAGNRICDIGTGSRAGAPDSVSVLGIRQSKPGENLRSTSSKAPTTQAKSKADAVRLLILLARHLPGGKWFVAFSTSSDQKKENKWGEAWDFVEKIYGQIPDSIRLIFPDRQAFLDYAPKSGVKNYRLKPSSKNGLRTKEKDWESFIPHLLTDKWLSERELSMLELESGPRSGRGFGG